MIWQIITIGKPAFNWIREGVGEYEGRLKHYAKLEMRVLPTGPRAKTAERMLEVSEGSWRVVLDERGKTFTSQGLAKWIDRQHLSGTKRISVLIGGADGHDPSVRSAANEIWSLSELTLQHEIALVLFLEQLYRAHTILKGEPYHRE